jgi:hypothetical protein
MPRGKTSKRKVGTDAETPTAKKSKAAQKEVEDEETLEDVEETESKQHNAVTAIKDKRFNEERGVEYLVCIGSGEEAEAEWVSPADEGITIPFSMIKVFEAYHKDRLCKKIDEFNEKLPDDVLIYTQKCCENCALVVIYSAVARNDLAMIKEHISRFPAVLSNESKDQFS